MSPKADKIKFMTAEEIDAVLVEMEQDELLNTGPIYIRDVDDSLRLVPFRERHTLYIRLHPKTNPQDYLANIRTMIRIRK